MLACLALCSSSKTTAKILHDDARGDRHPYSFYRCPEAAMDLEREQRNPSYQEMFHNGNPG